MLGAMLFALHPVQVEPVAWASETKDLLAGLLSIVALWQYVNYATTPDEPHERITKFMCYMLAMGAFALALLAKPNAVIAPLAAALIDVALIRRPVRRVIISLAPALLLAGVFAIIA